MANDVVAPEGTTQPPVTDGVNASWRDNLPDDLKGEKTLEKFVGKDWSEAGPALAKSYINLEKMPRGLTVPGEAATPEEWNAYHDKVRPAKIEEYGVAAKVPDGMNWSKEAEQRIVSSMHKRGLTTAQAQGVINDYLGIAHEGLLNMEQGKNLAIADAEKSMQDEWGGLYPQNIALVQRIVTEFGDDGFKAYLDDTGLGNDPNFLRFVYNLGRPMLEDNLVRGDGLGMRRNEAQAEIDAIMKTKEWLAGDKASIERISSLYPIANSD